MYSITHVHCVRDSNSFYYILWLEYICSLSLRSLSFTVDILYTFWRKPCTLCYTAKTTTHTRASDCARSTRAYSYTHVRSILLRGTTITRRVQTVKENNCIASVASAIVLRIISYALHCVVVIVVGSYYLNYVLKSELDFRATCVSRAEGKTTWSRPNFEYCI